ncbi:MAG: hypothetical protein LBI54_05775 [Lachnospiraceae bacterium]|nr:hypothetical protein [Lachnospiraceae bacterium]
MADEMVKTMESKANEESALENEQEKKPTIPEDEAKKSKETEEEFINKQNAIFNKPGVEIIANKRGRYTVYFEKAEPSADQNKGGANDGSAKVDSQTESKKRFCACFRKKSHERKRLKSDTYGGYYDTIKNSEIVNLITQVYMIRHRPVYSYLRDYQKNQVDWMLGNAIATIYGEEYDIAKKNLEDINEYLNNRNRETARKWHVEYSTVITALVFIIFGAIQIIAIKWNPFNIMDNFLYFKFVPVGALGATISIYQSGKSKDYNCESGKFVNIIEIFARIATGVVAAFLAICMYNMELILSSLKNHLSEVMVILCFSVGFGERFIPSVVGKFEKSLITPENDKSANSTKQDSDPKTDDSAAPSATTGQGSSPELDASSPKAEDIH